MEGKKDNVTLLETCKLLKKSKRTISRWIRAGKLNPKKVKGKKGSIEYQFKRTEVESLLTDTTGQVAGQADMVSFLMKQLEEKDKQIVEMNSRQRELNILLGQAQKKIFLLEDKSEDKQSDKGVIGGFFKRLFNR